MVFCKACTITHVLHKSCKIAKMGTLKSLVSVDDKWLQMLLQLSEKVSSAKGFTTNALKEGLRLLEALSELEREIKEELRRYDTKSIVQIAKNYLNGAISRV